MPINTLKFLLRFAKNPKSTGAIVPSSRYLARTMVENCENIDNNIVVELGAGTGSVTKELLKKFEADRLYSIELDEKLCSILRQTFPEARIVNDSAENIEHILKDEDRQLSVIISSLPLLSIPDFIVKNILEAVELSLPKGGKFIQFTYNLNRKPQELGFKSLKHVKTKKIFRNIPPARVDVFEKI